MSDRLPPLAPEQWSAEQRAIAEEIIRGPRGALLAPFVPLLRSPELLQHAHRMGEYLRYRNALGLRLSELAILITARHWSQQVEWAIHAPIAAREGVAGETIRDIADGRRPERMPADEAAVYEFCTELHHNRGVSDRTWNAVVERFGERGAVDLIGIAGYYAFLSMVMNASRTCAPQSTASKLKPLTE
ncbi:MAG: carboxymuconolactone decarboxylase family protein [Gemmatimonadota bacterium]